MYKRIIILLSFLAYSLSLVHSLVPHRHDEKAKVHHHHHHDNGNDHHHHEEEQENIPLSDVFASAIHQTSSELIFQIPESHHIKKSWKSVDLFVARISEIMFVRTEPPDRLANYQQEHYSFRQDSFYLLRAPPVA